MIRERLMSIYEDDENDENDDYDEGCGYGLW
jgi:hypothetical protein